MGGGGEGVGGGGEGEGGEAREAVARTRWRRRGRRKRRRRRGRRGRCRGGGGSTQAPHSGCGEAPSFTHQRWLFVACPGAYAMHAPKPMLKSSRLTQSGGADGGFSGGGREGDRLRQSARAHASRYCLDSPRAAWRRSGRRAPCRCSAVDVAAAAQRARVVARGARLLEPWLSRTRSRVGGEVSTASRKQLLIEDDPHHVPVGIRHASPLRAHTASHDSATSTASSQSRGTACPSTARRSSCRTMGRRGGRSASGGEARADALAVGVALGCGRGVAVEVDSAGAHGAVARGRASVGAERSSRALQFTLGLVERGAAVGLARGAAVRFSTISWP